jgi:pantetheine-phosphate adenylyltransferase
LLEVWLTSDSRAAKKDPRINSWDTRTGEMRKALGQFAERVSMHVLDDKHGPAPTHESASAIVCTAETRLECERINQIRDNNGLDELAIITVEHVDAWDGNPISSTRVRNGEIDREGLPWIPDSVRQGRIILTPEIEADPASVEVAAQLDGARVFLRQIREIDRMHRDVLAKDLLADEIPVEFLTPALAIQPGEHFGDVQEPWSGLYGCIGDGQRSGG